MKIYTLVKKLIYEYLMSYADAYSFKTLEEAQERMKEDFNKEKNNILSERNNDVEFEYDTLSSMDAMLCPFGSDFGYEWKIFKTDIN